MILYVNGDEHTAAAQAANDFLFANDDFSKVALGRKPHPDNLEVSWAMNLSKMLSLALVNDAESFSSNERILRSTYQFLDTYETKKYPYVMMVIGWTNWDRTEFLNSDNEYIQINPKCEPTEEELLPKYKEYIRLNKYPQKQSEWHEKIWELHNVLLKRKIPHLFFNSNDSFEGIESHKNWKDCYVNPYSFKDCYTNWSMLNKHVCNEFGHYRMDAHLSWARFLFSQLTNINKQL